MQLVRIFLRIFKGEKNILWQVVTQHASEIRIHMWMFPFQMSGQRYKRTNFEEDETVSPGGTTPTGGPFSPVVVVKPSSGFWHRRSLLECILFALLAILGVVIITMAISENRPGTPTVTKTVIMQQPEQSESSKPRSETVFPLDFMSCIFEKYLNIL